MNRDQLLDLIAKRESGNRNVNQEIVPAGGGFNPSVGRVTGPSSASGYFQMIDPTWRRAAGLAGVDTTQFPRAIDAPYEVQRQAAGALLDKDGIRHWAPYNAALRKDLGMGGASASLPAFAAGTAQPPRAMTLPAEAGGPVVPPAALASMFAPAPVAQIAAIGQQQAEDQRAADASRRRAASFAASRSALASMFG